jgi:hypothetical protein
MLSKQELFDLAVLRHSQHTWVTRMAVVVGTPTLMVAIEEMEAGFAAALMIACVWGSLVIWALHEGRTLCQEIERARNQLYSDIYSIEARVPCARYLP